MSTTAIVAINSLRETFKEADRIRFHSITTKGGSSVNTVPDEVIMESYVRGASVMALKEANKKVNRVIASISAAFGANATIEDISGSEPMHDNKDMVKCVEDVVGELFGAEILSHRGFFASSTETISLSILAEIKNTSKKLTLFPHYDIIKNGYKFAYQDEVKYYIVQIENKIHIVATHKICKDIFISCISTLRCKTTSL